MGLTLVTDEKTGISKYEYQKEEEKKPEIEIPQQSLGESLTDFSKLSELQSDWAETLTADDDDNVIEGALKSAARMPFNAGVEMLQETSDRIRDIADKTGIAPGAGTTPQEQDKGILGLGGWKPVNASSEGMPEVGRGLEQLGTGITQFAVMFWGLGKVLGATGFSQTAIGSKLLATEKAIQSGAAAKVGGGFLGKRIVGPLAGGAFNAIANPKGMAVDFFGFNQWDGRLYDLAANSNTWFENIKHIPLVNQLESNPDDTATEGALKNVFEGLLLDHIIGSSIKAFRGVDYTPKPKDVANLAVDTTKARGYTQQLLDATQKTGEGSPQYVAVKNKIEKLIRKVGENPIVRAMTGEKKGIPQNRIDQLPDARIGFELRSVDSRINQLEAQLKQLGQEPVKPEKGTFFEVVDGKKKKTKAALDYQADRKSRTKITKELDQLQAQRESLLEKQKVKTTDDLGPEPTDPKERQIYDRKRAEIDRDNPQTPQPQYTREQIERATKAVDVLVDPKTKKPFTPEQKELLTKRFLETKFGRLQRGVHGEIADALRRNLNMLNRGLSESEKARIAEQRVPLLQSIVERVAGKDAVVRWSESYLSSRQSRDYGGGKEAVDIWGSYDFADDIIDLHGIIYGDINDLIRTAWHEPFHRVQFVALDKRKLRVLNTQWARYKVELANIKTKAQIGGKIWKFNRPLAYVEGMTFAFERYAAAKSFGKDPIQALMPGMDMVPKSAGPARKALISILHKIAPLFDTILDFIEKSYNFLTDPKGKGFQSIRSIYEEIYRGDLNKVVQPEVAGERVRTLEYEQAIKDFETEMQGGGLDRDPKTMTNEELATATDRMKAIENLREWISNSEERSWLHPGGIWRTQDEGFRKVSATEADQIAKMEDLQISNYFNESRGSLQRAGGFAEDFNFPPGRYNTRYGQAEIIFKSSLDKAAWLIRASKTKLPKTYQKLLEALEAQGYDIAEMRALGDEIHDLIKDGIKNETGSAKAGANTAGVKLEVQPSIREEGADGFRSDDPYEIPDDDTIPKVEDYENTTENKAREAGIPLEDATDLPEVSDTSYRTNEAEISGVSESFIDNLEKYQRGEIDFKDLANDIVNIESPPSKNFPEGRIYSAEATNDEMKLLWDAASRFIDRIKATGMVALDMDNMVEIILEDARRFGINAQEINLLNTRLIATMADNVRNVENILKLRISLHVASREAGAKGMALLNAMKGEGAASADYGKLASELQHAVAIALEQFRNYQIITRGSAQNLKATQPNLGNLQGVNLVEGPTGSPQAGARFNVNPPELIDARDGIKDNVDSIFPPRVVEATKTGNWTPAAKQDLYQFANNISKEIVDPGSGIGALEKAMKGPLTGEKVFDVRDKTEVVREMPLDEVIGRTLATYRINHLLSAPLTWAVQTGIPFTRLLTEPVAMVFGKTLTRKGLIPWLDLKAGGQAMDLAQQWYIQMWMQAHTALRIAKQAFLAGHTLYDPYRRSSAWDLNTHRSLMESQGITKAMELDESSPAYNLNEMPLAKEISNNPNLLFIANAIHKFATFDIRTQGAIETFQKALAGNSFLYVEGLEEGLQQAGREGLSGKEAWYYAEEWAKAKVDHFTHDAVVRGMTITDAINTSPSALKLGRMLTFTDDVRATMPERNIDFGQDLAREMGIEGDEAINDYAIRYVEGTIDKFGKERTGGTEGLKAYLSTFTGKNSLPMAGEGTPSFRGFPTVTPSLIPMAWGKLQRMRAGWIATLIQSFNRSPGDMMKQIIRLTPAHLITDTGYRDFFDESSHLSKHWKAEIAVGATVTTAMSALWLNDNIKITGAGPSNPDAYKKWRAAGNYPLTIYRKLGVDENGFDVWSEGWSYRAYEPVSGLIQMFADFYEVYPSLTTQQREAISGSLPVTVAGLVINGRLRATYYEGIADFVDAILSWGGGGIGRVPTQPGEASKLGRYFSKLAVSFIPQSSRLRTLTQSIDKNQRIVPSGGERKVLDPKGERMYSFPGEGEPGKEGYIPAEDYRYRIEGTDNWIANSFFHLMNQAKKNLPFFSKDLPIRRNWITYDPILNPGVWLDEQLPYDSDPWYEQLTQHFLLTSLPAAAAFIPLIGSLPQFQGKRVEKQSPDNKKQMVMNELMRIHGMGGRFMAPDPSDLQSGVTLSAGAYDQYLKYISNTPHPEYGGKKLYEALYEIMASPEYQNAPPDIAERNDSFASSVRVKYLRRVIDDYREYGKHLFLSDPSNPFILEVLEERQRQNEIEATDEQYIEYGGPTSSNSDKVSPSSYVASLN